MSMLETIREFFKKVESAPVERTIADMLDNANVRETQFPSRVDGHPFVLGDSYFGVRLSGLHIVDARRFATERLPLCVCLAEFDHGGQRRSIPFSVGPDVIRSKLQKAGVTETGEAKPAWVELRNLPVVMPTPVTGGNLSLYAGLFSVPGDDLVKNLLNVVGTVGSALGQPAVGASIKVAETIYNSFGALLSLHTVQQLSAALIGASLTEGGSGYLLIAKVAAKEFDPRRGQVIDGRLHWPADVKGGAAVAEFDYALLAIEYYHSIVEEATGLAPTLFQSVWLAALALPQEQSESAFVKLQDAIAGSPDVTENDRIALLSGYSLRFEQIATARGWRKSHDTTRGASDAPLTDRVTQLAQSLERKSRESSDGRKQLSAQAQALHAIAAVDIGTPELLESAQNEQRSGDLAGVLAAARKVRANLDDVSARFEIPPSRLSSLVHRSMRLTDL